MACAHERFDRACNADVPQPHNANAKTAIYILPCQHQFSHVCAGTDVHSEVAAVRYDVNVLGTKGPRKMTAIVPAIDMDSQRPVGCSPSIHADNSIMERCASMTLTF